MSRTPTPGPLEQAEDFSVSSEWTSTKARYALVEGIRMFYREAGRPSAPTLLLLHGFPTSSHMYRALIPILATQYHVIAPDMPGFGFTEVPDRALYPYSFDSLARTMDAFMETLRLPEYAVQVFDYGAPVGFRLALAHPDRITALISQNGNGYKEGLSAGWDPIQRYWRDPSAANRSALRALLTPESVKWQYTHGVADVTQIAPESFVLDSALLTRPQVDEIQLDLSSITPATSISIRHSSSIFDRANHRCSRCGGKMIHSFCRRVPMPFNAIFAMPKYTSMTPDTLLSKPIVKKSAPRFLNFSTGY